MAEKMSDPRELFLHELGDILYAEKQILKTLPKLQKESSDEKLAGGFEKHVEDTRNHVENLEAAFKELGEKVKAEQCPGIDGIIEEHDEFVKEEKPSAEILDMFNTGSGARTEHYEIAAYTGLVTKARAMGEDKVAKLLETNLKDEQRMLGELEKLGERLAKNAPVAA
jgi:ferritin-like metal-binding protein YciE